MIIKSYGDIPPAYAPDIGEVVHARRARSDAWTKAAVVGVQRRKNSMLKITVQWLDDDPHADGGAHPIVFGDVGYLRMTTDWVPLLIKQISRDDA